MKPALNTDQQRQILQAAKNLTKQSICVNTKAKCGYVSLKSRDASLKEQEARFCDFLKEL